MLGAVRFFHDGAQHELSPDGRLTKVDPGQKPQLLRTARWAGDEDIFELLSPNGEFVCSLAERTLRIDRTEDRQSACLKLTCASSQSWELGRAQWSPDSRMLATLRLDFAGIPTLPMTRWLGPKEVVEWIPATRTGEPYPRPSLVIADALGHRVQFDFDPESTPIVIPICWREDSSEFLVIAAPRTMEALHLLAADPTQGSTRRILTERSNTFVEGLRLYQIAEDMVFQLEGGQHFLWLSARDEWHRLWLVGWDGAIKKCVTPPGLEILRVLRQRPGSEQVFFAAHERLRPYDTHLFALDIPTNCCTRLTLLPGQHLIGLSPSCAYYLDRHGSLDRDLATDLHRIDGTHVRSFPIHVANTSSDPDVREIVLRAADGQTELWGILVVPSSPSSQSDRYPVVDLIYNGPFVTWSPRTRYEALNGLPGMFARAGIAALVIDGRGTPERGKTFQDMAYRGFGTHEVDDHVSALKELCDRYRFLDPNRVGICGGSWGGYMSIRAILKFPEIYKVAVATNPVHNFIDHPAAAIEPYMGLPDQNPRGFEEASNLPLASALRGRLLIVHGTADRNAPLIGTMKMIAELIQHQKEFDLVLFPDEGHQFTGKIQSYWLERLIKYFLEHL